MKLTEQSISFKDIEITKNQELWKQVTSQTGYDLLPTVFIQNDDNSTGTVYIPDRDFQDINEIIEIIKSNI
jgi:glutaredoxin